MPIKANFKIQDVTNRAEQFLKDVLDDIILASYAAASSVAGMAKQTNTYIDRTNNLRSSIGFVVYHNGQSVHSNFEVAGAGISGDGSEGTKNGKVFADEVAQQYSNGIAIVIVAGMKYALYVESRGYDVITGSTLEFPGVFTQYIDEVNKKHNINITQVK